jgi:hypothetical protein
VAESWPAANEGDDAMDAEDVKTQAEANAADPAG